MERKPLLTLLGIHTFWGLWLLKDTLVDPFNRTVGHADSDLYPHLWGYWRWIRKWISGGFTETWNNAEPFLNAPFTGELYHVDWLNGMLVWMGTQIGMPFLVSVNAMILLQWMLMGIGVIALCKQVNLTFWSSLFVLLSLNTTPFIERFVLHSAVFERLNLGWLLLYLTVLFHVSVHKQWRYCILGIVCFGLTVLGSWHYAMFAILASVWIAGWYITQDRSLWKVYLGLAIGCATIAYPLSTRAQSSLETDSIIEHKAQQFWDWNTRLEVLNDFQWMDLFMPTVKQSFGFDVLEESVFIGILIPLAWVLFLGVNRFRRTWTGLWFGMSVYFAIISLGPEITLWDGLTIYSPIYYGTAGLIPYFSTMEVPWEYSWMALMSGSILCAIMMEQLGKYMPLFSIVLLAQYNICFSEVIASTAPITIEAEVLKTLKSSNKSIVNFPIHNHTSDNKQSPHHEYLWMQTLHNRPIAYGIQQSWLHQSELWRQLNEHTTNTVNWREVRQHCKIKQCQHHELFRTELQRQHFDHFVLHLNFIPPDSRRTQINLWAEVFGPPIVESDTHVVYALFK